MGMAWEPKEGTPFKWSGYIAEAGREIGIVPVLDGCEHVRLDWLTVFELISNLKLKVAEEMSKSNTILAVRKAQIALAFISEAWDWTEWHNPNEEIIFA